MLTTQWSSSNQARCVSCLEANGAIRHQSNRDISPDRIVDLATEEGRRGEHGRFTRPQARVIVNQKLTWEELCAATDVLEAAGLEPDLDFHGRLSYLEVPRG